MTCMLKALEYIFGTSPVLQSVDKLNRNSCSLSNSHCKVDGHQIKGTIHLIEFLPYFARETINVCDLLLGFPHAKKGKRKVQGVPQSQTAALPRPQEEEETDKSKQAQTEQTYEKH